MYSISYKSSVTDRRSVDCCYLTDTSYSQVSINGINGYDDDGEGEVMDIRMFSASLGF